MKSKAILLWVLLLGLAAAAGALYLSNQKKDAELATLRAQSQELEQVSMELAELKENGLAVQNQEIERLRRDNEDLLRLRSEVRQLRDEKDQVLKQVQTAQAAADQAQNQLQVQSQQTRQFFQTTACMNNLRQMDAAKQQWALEKQQPPEAVPPVQDVLPYMPGNTIPACPAGGQYSLNAVGQETTCSIPGHALTK